MDRLVFERERLAEGSKVKDRAFRHDVPLDIQMLRTAVGAKP